MLKAILSRPVDGKTTHEKYVATKEKAMTVLKDKGYEVIDILYADDLCIEEQIQKRGVVQVSLYFLAKYLENMSLCHAVYFCKGWEKACICRIEHEIAVAYGLEIIYEN